MKKIPFILLFILAVSCKHDLIRNKERLEDMDRMLKVQKELTHSSKTDIWGIFGNLSGDERQAMEFLYAYMPLSDLADYPSSFFLANVKQSLLARKETSWGKSVPEDVFLHFVLPLRVNNENLDSFRMTMYSEIRDRIRGMKMEEAALEINHWCHEKVTYRGTDARTSAPLSTIRKSFGRCGEESTFTVSAMRTAGIPARQVYTPRWAHSDDNHAWVEVWIDGKWKYLGACEPEPVLNKGWFDEPSRRTMLVHTRAYGRYFGQEDIVSANQRFSELNLTSNYATVKDIFVKVMHPDNSPADNARVEFRLYNYAEFYPIATAFSDKKGVARLKTGMGDLLIWASKDGMYACKKFSVPEQDTLTLTLNFSQQGTMTEILDMIPPHAVKAGVEVSREDREKNTRRLAREDSIRNRFMASFKDSAWAAAFASKLALNADTVRSFISRSYGNWKEISAFLGKNSRTYRHSVLALASRISDKDFSDTREPVLTDHLVNAVSGTTSIPEDIYLKYILSPRVSIEFLSPWRSFLKKNLGVELAGKAQDDIITLTTWIRTNIRIDENANLHSRAPLTPAGVYNLGAADPLSRDIFFVAACRTFGIPARLNPETQVPEYWKNGKWLLAGFEETPPVQPEKGTLKLTQKNNPIEPQYFYHFTIARIYNGKMKTLEFEEGKRVSSFTGTITLDTGRYVLVTGNRMQDGPVLSSMSFFNIEAGKVTHVPVELRQLPGNLKASGKIDFSTIRIISRGQELPLSQMVQNQSSVVMLIDPDKEPSKHILNDLGSYVDHFNKWNGRFIVAVPPEKRSQAGVLNTYALPEKLISGIDADDNLFKAFSKIYGNDLKDKLPLVMVGDSNGNIYLFSSGYRIGIGEQILKITPALAAIQASCEKVVSRK